MEHLDELEQRLENAETLDDVYDIENAFIDARIAINLVKDHIPVMSAWMATAFEEMEARCDLGLKACAATIEEMQQEMKDAQTYGTYNDQVRSLYNATR
jgi:hypothetical protein